jgi:hypothetical protein
MIYDSALLERNKRYKFHKMTLIFSHASWNARNTKTFVFRTLRGDWKRLSRNQLRLVDAVEGLREGFYE